MKNQDILSPPRPRNVLVLGTFDGVHLGHRALLHRAKAVGQAVTVYTFTASPHGASFLTLPADRERLLLENGADAVVFDDFASVRGMSPEDFVEEILLGRLRADAVVCGFNYRFGSGARGDGALLASLLCRASVRLSTVDAVKVDGDTVSSTRIRALCAAGNMEAVEKLLARPFFYRLPILSGKRIGRTIGIPTANQRIPSGLLTLPRGVYAARAITQSGDAFAAVANIGFRPTVNRDESDITCETHLIGFAGDLYGQELKVEFLSHLRGEMKFDSLDALRAQIGRDIEATEHILCRRTEPKPEVKGGDGL